MNATFEVAIHVIAQLHLTSCQLQQHTIKSE
jgi:hypothetical protein